MRARTLTDNEVDLKQDVIDSLKMRLHGSLLVPDDHGYEETSTVWNAMIDRKPALVARCIGNADVIECVRFAREHELLLCIKAGGHNIAGLAVADGALMLDLSLMRGAWVDTERNIVRAQGGCLLGDVDRETQVHGSPLSSASYHKQAVRGSPLAAGSDI